MSAVFQLSGPLLDGVFAIEASAGTGKTYSLTGLVARHVSERGLRPDQLLMVTFTRAATAEMRDRTRTACRALLDVLQTEPRRRMDIGADPWMLDIVDVDENENARRAGNIRTFLATYDEATITTIHGFCQQVLNRAGLVSPAVGAVTLAGDASDMVAQVIADVLIGSLSEHPDLFGSSPSGSEKSMHSAVKDLTRIVKAVMSNPSTVRIPDVPHLESPVDLVALEPEQRWAVIVDRVVRTVHERRQASGTFGYDDLIHSVVDMLLGPQGARLVRSLREQYRLVLIDEFQDTDIGQWTIFERAFIAPSTGGSGAATPELSLGIVGDPKQAIYRFRGADIDAYRSAVASIGQRVELSTNYRSNAKVIEAVNALLAGVTFGDASIEYKRVSSRTSPPEEGVEGHVPVEIRFVPYSTEAGSGVMKSGLRKAEKLLAENGLLDKWKVNTDLALELVYADLAMSIADLIESGRIIDKSGEISDVRPGDIAVLVRAHKHAERIRNVFAAAGIPAVRYRARSVFDSPAALEWRVFLSALAVPSSLDRVRGAALSVFGRTSLATLLAGRDGDAEIEAWQRTCAEWSTEVARVGLSTVYFRLRSDREFMARVAGEVDGERLLTDLDHIAEVLAAVPELARGAGAADCLQVLDRYIDEAEEEDEYQRRIETDADSVHIATIHHSKGLEFPIVFLPTMMKMVPSQDTPYVFSSDGRRVIDLATPVEWTWENGALASHDERKDAATADMTGDLMRMLYVAMTRAEQKVVLYWTPLTNSASSSLGRLLFSSIVEGRPELDSAAGVPAAGVLSRSNAEMLARLEEIADRSEHITVTQVASQTIRRRSFARRSDSGSPLGVARFTRVEPLRRPAWGKWSYSGVASALGTLHASMAEPFLPGADEGQGQATAGVARRSGGPVLFPDELYGAEFGSRIHEIFESIDPSSTDIETEIERAVLTRFGRRTDDETISRLTTALGAACTTPLGPVFAGRDLAGLSRADRLAEMVFDMRISDVPVPVARIGTLLMEHLDPEDPFAEYGASLIDRAARLRMAGFLYGEVDAVFRIEKPDGSWSIVVSDYKTNLLHDSGSPNPLDAYRRDELARTMADDHYVLQAVIYQVAVHRYLRWRLADYRPEEHLGGIAYLFVRGLVGADAPVGPTGEPTGVFTWKPPQSLIDALDSEFSQ